MEKLIITAAICGAEVTKEQNPAVPYTVEEIVREAKSAYDAGAAIVHLHVREDDGTPTQSRERFRVCIDAIRQAIPDVILIPSTGGAVGMTAEERLQPTELMPEMATLDCGTCNFGDDVFENTMPTMRAFGKRMIENGRDNQLYHRFKTTFVLLLAGLICFNHILSPSQMQDYSLDYTIEICMYKKLT